MASMRPVAAGLFSALIFIAGTATALADKGGVPHNPNAGAPPAAGHGNGNGNGNANGNGNGNGNAGGAPGGSIGPGGLTGGPNAPHGNGNAGIGGPAIGGGTLGEGAVTFDGKNVTLRTANGTASFEIANDGVKRGFAALHGNEAILYSLDGKRVSSVGEPNETITAKVTKRDRDDVIVTLADGEQRSVHLGHDALDHMRVGNGSTLELRTFGDSSRVSVRSLGASRGRAVANGHTFDKFARGAAHHAAAVAARAKAHAKGRDAKKAVALADPSRSHGKKKCGEAAGGPGGSPAGAIQASKDASNDASGHNPPGLPHECINPAGNTRGFCKSGGGGAVDCSGASVGGGTPAAVAAMTAAQTKDRGAKKCGDAANGGANPAYANQMAKDAANDASGHNPPGLPHECVNPAGHVRGFCRSGGSSVDCGSITSASSTPVASAIAGGRPGKKCGDAAAAAARRNPAYANQMSKDAANDASGHNPPGLPHECVNPAGNTRGFCKSRTTDVADACSGASGGVAAALPAPVVVPAARRVPIPASGQGFRPASGRAPVGAPAGSSLGGPLAPTTSRAVASAPAAIKPVGARHAALRRPTRVLAASRAPVARAVYAAGAKPCVWHKSQVLASGSHPFRVPTSAVAGHHPRLMKKCRLVR